MDHRNYATRPLIRSAPLWFDSETTVSSGAEQACSGVCKVRSAAPQRDTHAFSGRFAGISSALRDGDGDRFPIVRDGPRLPPTRPALSALGRSGPPKPTSPQAHWPRFNMPTDAPFGNLILPYLGLASNSKWRGLRCAQMHTQQPPGPPPNFASEVRLFVGSNPIWLQTHATEMSDVTLTHPQRTSACAGKEPTYLLAAPPPMSCPSL